MKWTKIAGATVATSGLLFSTSAFAATSGPNFQQDGFPTVVASQVIQPTASATVTAGNITISIPAGAFGSDPVTFDVLEGPTASMTPDGTTALADFAFKVTDNTTQNLITAFAKPVTFSITSPQITSASEYWDVSPSGALSINPIPSTISGDTLSHKIAGAPVGWVVANPVAAPDFTQWGFPQVVASTNFTPGTATSVSANGISISIPANAFNVPVTFDLLQGPVQNFAAHAPSGQSPVADFAFKVVDQDTHTLVGSFSGAVIASITNSQINQKSEYLDVTTAGSEMPNPIPAKITNDVLVHPIKAATVGWVVTSPSVAAATSPVTGLPIAPVVAGGAALFIAGSALLWKRTRGANHS